MTAPPGCRRAGREQVRQEAVAGVMRAWTVTPGRRDDEQRWLSRGGHRSFTSQGEPSGLGGGAGRAVQELTRQDLQRCFYPVLLLAAHPGHDLTDGLLYTRCGPAFAAVWAITLGIRVAFIWALQDVPWFTRTAGTFIRDHQIGRSAIAAAFVLMAVAMYGLRFAVIAVRARQAPRAGPARPGSQAQTWTGRKNAGWPSPR